jgi:hypothetical protein
MSFKMYRSEPLTEPEKRYLRKVNGVKSRFAIDQVSTSDKPKDRDFTCPTNITKTISRKKKRGFNGCKMSDEVRAQVEARAQARVEFYRAMGKRV